LDNVGTSTGDLLDEVKAANVPVTISVAEIVGLDLTVTAIAGSSVGDRPRADRLQPPSTT